MNEGNLKAVMVMAQNLRKDREKVFDVIQALEICPEENIQWAIDKLKEVVK